MRLFRYQPRDLLSIATLYGGMYLYHLHFDTIAYLFIFRSHTHADYRLTIKLSQFISM